MFCPLTPDQIAATTAQLTDATTAYHNLLTGKAVVRVKDQNGEELEYSQASAVKLLAYIQTLTDQLNPAHRHNAPMRLSF
jgi:hypothetical protein